MNKILMGTSAVALSSMVATSANAAKWDLDWGGYFEAYVGAAFVDGDEDFDGVDVRADREIIFTPSITLDNGLKFGVDIQLEGNTSGDTIDESFAFVKGSFGQILIGSENSAGYKMSYAAPDFSAIGINSSSVSAYIPLGGNFFRTPGISSFVEVDGNNDAERITYFTPRFSGFQLGVSYARDATEGFGAVNLDNNLGNIFDIGANYVNDFGGFDVALAGRYGTADAPGAADDPDTFAVGLNLGFSGVTIGGSYASEDGGNTANDGDFFDVGISYATGPWGVSLTYAHSDLDGLGEMDTAALSAKYALGPGVKVIGTVAYADQSDARAAAAGTTANDAIIIETGFTLNF